MNFINKNDELTLTHVNETKGADLSIAALHKERNKYKIPKQFMSTLNSGKSKELDRPLARSKSERRISTTKGGKRVSFLNTENRERSSSVLKFLKMKSFKNLNEKKDCVDTKKLLTKIQEKLKYIYKPSQIKKKNPGGSKRTEWGTSQSSDTNE